MIIEKLVVGPLFTNCYILAAGKGSEAVIIDPGAEANRILKTLREFEFKLRFILLTHSHFDHIGAVQEVAQATHAKICLYQDGESIPFIPDIFLKESKDILIDGLTLEIIYTPGHSQDSVSLYFPGHLFTGDLLFAGSVGRTDLAGGSMKDLISSLKEKILSLPDDTLIFPGHGPETKLGLEKKSNYFLKEVF